MATFMLGISIPSELGFLHSQDIPALNVAKISVYKMLFMD